ncbi:MAG: ABC transporter ATP-binding protein [Chloroflexota bacterium]
MTEPIILARSLSKSYGDFAAVGGLDLAVQEGEVYGFLGPNGSGKSTTILMLLGLTEPSGGSVRVCGHDPSREPLAVKRQVGYLPESVGLYGDLTGRQNLRYTAELNAIPRREADARIEQLLETVELTTAADVPAGHYSRGMRQRLGLADVLLKQPRLVILDDPTLGLDPAGIQWLLAMIHDLSTRQGITVFLSSHALVEVQRICSRVGIMSHGKMVLQGTVAELLRDRSGGFQVSLEVEESTPGLRAALESLEGVSAVREEGERFVLTAVADLRAEAAAAAVAVGARLVGLHAQDRTLEEIYLRYFHEGNAA